MVLGLDGWTDLSCNDVTRLVRRLRDDPVQLGRLATRCAEHGRGRMLVALVVEADPVRGVTEALVRSVEVFGLLAPDPGEPAERAAYLRVVTSLMRLTALQLLLLEQPQRVPAEVVTAWPIDTDGERLSVGRLDRDRVSALLQVLDEHELLLVP